MGRQHLGFERSFRCRFDLGQHAVAAAEPQAVALEAWRSLEKLDAEALEMALEVRNVLRESAE